MSGSSSFMLMEQAVALQIHLPGFFTQICGYILILGDIEPMLPHDFLNQNGVRKQQRLSANRKILFDVPSPESNRRAAIRD